MRGHHIKAYRHSNHMPDWRTHYVYVQCVIGYDCKDHFLNSTHEDCDLISKQILE